MKHRVATALLSAFVVAGPAALADRPQPEGEPDEAVKAELVRLTEEISESIAASMMLALGELSTIFTTAPSYSRSTRMSL